MAPFKEHHLIRMHWQITSAPKTTKGASRLCPRTGPARGPTKSRQQEYPTRGTLIYLRFCFQTGGFVLAANYDDARFINCSLEHFLIFLSQKIKRTTLFHFIILQHLYV